MVLATKYFLAMDHSDRNAADNHRKNIIQTVENNLKNLNTDIMDLFGLHVDDEDISIDKTVRVLDDLLRMGKISYIGISDTPT